ncbi:MAG: hypothetical protein VKL39_00420 [Leptolyngbyaceae bacterium]|nr:hypothetical protein [Leptolyngbyaceae bacterium]
MKKELRWKKYVEFAVELAGLVYGLDWSRGGDRRPHTAPVHCH